MFWAAVEIETDLLTLASAMVPNKDDALAQFFKVPLNDDGFLWSAMPSSDPPNLPPTAFSSAVWPTIPNPLMNPWPRAGGGLGR
jgi:hypothetical protein